MAIRCVAAYKFVQSYAIRLLQSQTFVFKIINMVHGIENCMMTVCFEGIKTTVLDIPDHLSRYKFHQQRNNYKEELERRA